jgi:hypothetical protein
MWVTDSIEDTAVELSDLPNYIADFSAMMKKHGQDAIYYAHGRRNPPEAHFESKTREGLYQLGLSPQRWPFWSKIQRQWEAW